MSVINLILSNNFYSVCSNFRPFSINLSLIGYKKVSSYAFKAFKSTFNFSKFKDVDIVTCENHSVKWFVPTCHDPAWYPDWYPAW